MDGGPSGFGLDGWGYALAEEGFARAHGAARARPVHRQLALVVLLDIDDGVGGWLVGQSSVEGAHLKRFDLKR